MSVWVRVLTCVSDGVRVGMSGRRLDVLSIVKDGCRRFETVLVESASWYAMGDCKNPKRAKQGLLLPYACMHSSLILCGMSRTDGDVIRVTAMCQRSCFARL